MQLLHKQVCKSNFNGSFALKLCTFIGDIVYNDLNNVVKGSEKHHYNILHINDPSEEYFAVITSDLYKTLYLKHRSNVYTKQSLHYIHCNGTSLYYEMQCVQC
jgi:hypothetical protein